jgi:hypothetical protein
MRNKIKKEVQEFLLIILYIIVMGALVTTLAIEGYL